MAHMGLQLFSVKEEAARDLPGALRAVAAMGYDGVEFAGYHGNAPEGLAAVLEQTGLRSAASHIMLDALEEDFDAQVEACEALPCATIICPFIPRDQRGTITQWRHLADRFNDMGRRLSERGIRFLYHHHGFDFEPIAGTTGFEILKSHTESRYLGFEIDAYWLEVSGLNATEVYLANKDRVPSLHLKNMKSRADHHDIELADGVIDLPRLVAAALSNGIQWLVVEQEKFERDPMESARLNYQHLRSMVEAV